VRVLEETSSHDAKEIAKSTEIIRLLGYVCTHLCVCVCVHVCVEIERESRREGEREREREREI
jgi:hypothetical protein